MQLTGLVLCGGKSTRMGTDKGMVKKGDRTWAQVVLEKFSNFEIPSKLSINETQINQYSEMFNSEDLIIDKAKIPGPLKGILSAHLQYPDKNWLVLACDLIDMDAATMKSIIDLTSQEPGFEFYVFKNDNYFEPFCGIYTSTGLSRFFKHYQDNLIEDFSFQNLLKTSKTASIALKDNHSSFKNYNSNT